MRQYTGPLRFAHRGVVQTAPENTINAFQAAVDSGLEGIEIDVQLSKDGEIIVVHDSNLTRLTIGHPKGGSNRHIEDMTWEELSRVELPYANHTLPVELPPHSELELLSIPPYRLSGQEPGFDYETALKKDGRMAGLMRFSDFDKWLAGQRHDLLVEIEVKAAGIMPRMLEILDATPNKDQYILFSGVPAYNEEIQSACRRCGKPAGLRLGANIRFLTDEHKAWVERSDLFEVGLNAENYTADDVHWLADHGVQVLSNLGDHPHWWAQLCQTGALGFKTNYSQAFTRWWMENAN